MKSNEIGPSGESAPRPFRNTRARWTVLVRCFHDGPMALENNPAERALRGPRLAKGVSVSGIRCRRPPPLSTLCVDRLDLRAICRTVGSAQVASGLGYRL